MKNFNFIGVCGDDLFFIFIVVVVFVCIGWRLFMFVCEFCEGGERWEFCDVMCSV